MRRCALAILAVLGAGCGGQTVGESGSCAAAVIYDDTVYVGHDVKGSRLRPGEPLEGGISPACRDTIPADPDARDQPTKLRRVDGVAPEIAVWVPWERRRNAVYVNAGSFPELRDHPLHEAIYGSPNRPRPLRRAPNCRFDGMVERVGLSVEVQPATGLERFVYARVDTSVDGFVRGGWPVLRRGDRVHVVGECDGRQVIAHRIEPQS